MNLTYANSTLLPPLAKIVVETLIITLQSYLLVAFCWKTSGAIGYRGHRTQPHILEEAFCLLPLFVSVDRLTSNSW